MDPTRKADIEYFSPNQAGATVKIPVYIDVDGVVVKMKLLHDEQIETLATNSTGFSLNAFSGVLTLSIGLMVTLWSEGIKTEYTGYVKLFLLFLLIPLIYFGVQARNEWNIAEKAKTRIKTHSKTVDIVAPILEDSVTKSD